MLYAFSKQNIIPGKKKVKQEKVMIIEAVTKR